MVICISIKPKTPANVLEQYMDKIDLILIMTVEPGFGGQKFMSDQVEKIKQIKQMIGQKDIEIQVDGGINLENAPIKIINPISKVLFFMNQIYKI